MYGNDLVFFVGNSDTASTKQQWEGVKQLLEQIAKESQSEFSGQNLFIMQLEDEVTLPQF